MNCHPIIANMQLTVPCGSDSFGPMLFRKGGKAIWHKMIECKPLYLRLSCNSANIFCEAMAAQQMMSEALIGIWLPFQTVHTKTAKLTIDRLTMTGELYDLSDVPHEPNNQLDKPSYATLHTELMAMIDARPDDRRETQIQFGMA